MASGGSGLRITDVEYSNTPDIAAKVFINDAGRLRQTDLDTMVKYSSIYQEVVEAGETATANVAQAVQEGHEKLLEDINAVDDLRTAVSDINSRLDNLSSDASDITLAAVSGMSATNVEDAIKELNTSYETCFQSVSDGKSAVATALTTQGVSTSATATYATMAANVGRVATNKYNAGITYADGRANTSSTNYTTGYNAGVVAADGRANANSTNYKSGYNAGVTAADNRANAASVNYKTGYNAGYAAGGNGKYKVATGTVKLTGRSNSNGWSTVAINTGLASVKGGMARMVGTYGVGSGNAFYHYSSSGGTITYYGVDFNGDVTFYWMAYGT